jgi:hypothetical protein
MSLTLRHLTDEELIAAVASLAGQARAATAALIAHLAELEARDLHRAQGYRSLYAYCRGVLHLSEHESYHRMEAARAARRFPVLLALLAEGRLHLTAVSLLAPRLTDENHLALLGGAIHKSKAEVEMLLARWFPRPDVKTSNRRVPTRSASQGIPADTPSAAASTAGVLSGEAPSPGVASAGDPIVVPAAAEASPGAPTTVLAPVVEDASGVGAPDGTVASGRGSGPVAASPAPESSAPPPPQRARSSIAPLSQDSYDVRFRARSETVARLRRAQELLSHAVPDGDVDEILFRALGALIAQTEKRRHAGRIGARGTHGRRSRGVAPASRGIPADVEREVWARDAGQCAFIAKSGRRCEERRFLQFHHVKPWAASGPPTIANISLRCRAHNDYEARVYFGPIRKAMAERAAMAEIEGRSDVTRRTRSGPSRAPSGPPP